jgi:hypothetical protein
MSRVSSGQTPSCFFTDERTSARHLPKKELDQENVKGSTNQQENNSIFTN